MFRFERSTVGPVGMLIAFLIGAGSPALAQVKKATPATDDDERDHAIIYELGFAGEWSRSEGFHPGATFAFEVTPIAGWLEVEIGFTAIRGDGAVEMPVDVLFKKPWQISPTFEFMIGLGPELVHVTGRDAGTFWGLSSVVDFMFWPKKNVGWYVEPGFEVTFREGATQRGLGIAGGLLIGR